MRPLEGLFIIDFSTLLPGPLASLILAEAGATVVKVERPGHGDLMRTYAPKIGDESVRFAMLNRGKQSIALDLKASDAVTKLTPLLQRADVLIEQFRPGVMDRLGLGYPNVQLLNPRLVYCSITGWGQTGPKALRAGHDLNYLAECGMLGLSAGSDGAPTLLPLLTADVAGGAFPAVLNILLALRQRDLSGVGCNLDISMSDNLFSCLDWALSSGFANSKWPQPGRSLVTGGSPRYQIYRTADGRYLAAAPLEDNFWKEFTRIISLPAPLCDSTAPYDTVIAAVAERIAQKSAAQWQVEFANVDACCSIVATLDEAVADPQFAARGLFAQLFMVNGQAIPSLPLPLAPVFRQVGKSKGAPSLGGANGSLLAKT